MGTIRVKSGAGGNDVVFCRADGPLRAVRILYVRGDQLPSQIHGCGQIQKWLAALVVHSYGVDGDSKTPKKLNCSS